MVMEQSSKNSRIIKASPEKLYAALTDARALETWQAPGDMRGKVHQMDLRVGGGYEMSLYYPEGQEEMQDDYGSQQQDEEEVPPNNTTSGVP